ncbi:MAG TPA: hypothetical protein VK785_08250 [Opitutaceae bacterium]|nr:hypothetical protein [Opitutaceae bacterium]
MSLINDALKKAQKLQTQGQAPLPPTPGGAPGRPAGSGRNRPLPTQIFALLALGAGALIALSVLGTVYLLRQPAPPVVAQAPAPMLPEKPATAPAIKTAPTVFQPANPAPATTQTLAPVLEKSPPLPAPASTPAIAATPPVIPQPPAIVPPLPPVPSLTIGLDPSKPDPKILAYIDALQVAGVRVTGTGSKVLMNDRVYRENEIVDHLLGLRLKKIESDILTFIDERGVIYTKNL